MKQHIRELLREHHPNEIGRLVGLSDNEAKKIVREIYLNDWGYANFDDWETQNVGEYGHVLFLKQGDEWIDEDGYFRCFYSKEAALEHLRSSLTQWHLSLILKQHS